MASNKISRGQKQNLSLKTSLSIPKIELELEEKGEEKGQGYSYVSLSEVDQSKISPQFITPSGTPVVDHSGAPPFTSRTIPSKNDENLKCDKFFSLTSFDARTKPEPTYRLSFDSAIFLTAISIYLLMQGIIIGQSALEVR